MAGGQGAGHLWVGDWVLGRVVWGCVGEGVGVGLRGMGRVSGCSEGVGGGQWVLREGQWVPGVAPMGAGRSWCGTGASRCCAASSSTSGGSA